jgi:hypothetical protein
VSPEYLIQPWATSWATGLVDTYPRLDILTFPVCNRVASGEVPGVAELLTRRRAHEGWRASRAQVHTSPATAAAAFQKGMVSPGLLVPVRHHTVGCGLGLSDLTRSTTRPCIPFAGRSSRSAPSTWPTTQGRVFARQPDQRAPHGWARAFLLNLAETSAAHPPSRYVRQETGASLTSTRSLL